MASAFPPRYTQAMMAGQGLAGLTVSLAGLFTTLAGPDDKSCIVGAEKNAAVERDMSSRRADAFGDPHPAGQVALDSLADIPQSSCSAYARDWSTLVYFGVAVVVLLGCMLTYPLLARLPVTKFYSRSDEDGAVMDGTGAEAAQEGDMGGKGITDDTWLRIGRSAVVSSSTSPTGSAMYRRLMESPPLPLLSQDEPLSDSATHETVEGMKRQMADRPMAVGIETSSGLGGIRSKLEPISRYAFAVCMVFVVTLSVFPGATSEIVSSRKCERGRSRFFAGDVFVMFSFVSFNAFDLLGRVATGLALVLPSEWLPAASVSRLMFVPLFLACRSENSRFPNWFPADVFPLVLMPLFAFTNGYVGSLSMMAGSQKGAWAGTAMVLFLNAGLLAGSLLSFVVLFATAES